MLHYALLNHESNKFFFFKTQPAGYQGSCFNKTQLVRKLFASTSCPIEAGDNIVYSQLKIWAEDTHVGQAKK
jgi:hypothetical protein